MNRGFKDEWKTKYFHQFKNENEDKNFYKLLNKFKTEQCKNFELLGKCKFGKSCHYAHGQKE